MPADNLAKSRTNPSDWLLILLIATLPLMKPPIAYPIILADIVFLSVIAAASLEILLGTRRFQLRRPELVLLAYCASLCLSILISSSLGSSLTKVAEILYLAGLAGVTAWAIDSEAKLRLATRAWLGATAAMILLAPISVVLFYVSPGSPLLAYASTDFGSLAPGNYPRLALTFFNQNMMCNYLTVSLGLLLAAYWCRWIKRRGFVLLLAGIMVAAITTISPGLGGIALLGGLWAWLAERDRAPRRARIALASGIIAAILFAVALGVTPIVYPTAPFLIHVPGSNLVLAPSGRFLTWSSAAKEFLGHPLLGHGIGIDAASVTYPRPDGFVEHLTDAHNMFLNIGAQAGMIGLIGLAAVIALGVRLTGPLVLDGRRQTALRLGLGLSFLDAFVYQGLGGSFEDSRHIWVALGLLIAASRIDFIRADGNNHRAGGPSPC